jgi:hypothetical protein
VAAVCVSYAIAIACGGKASTLQDAAVPGVPAVWSFTGNCDAGLALACGNVVCPPFEGGTAAQACDPPFASCVNAPPYANKSFVCEPTGHAVWSLNAYCGAPPFTDCAASGLAACATFDGGVIAGQPCSTPLAACSLGDALVYACVPGGGDFWVFNGYCGEDAGPLFQACSSDSGACPSFGDDAEVVGTPCSSALERCVNAEEKIFVCTPR